MLVYYCASNLEDIDQPVKSYVDADGLKTSYRLSLSANSGCASTKYLGYNRTSRFTSIALVIWGQTNQTNPWRGNAKGHVTWPDKINCEPKKGKDCR